MMFRFLIQVPYIRYMSVLMSSLKAEICPINPPVPVMQRKRYNAENTLLIVPSLRDGA